MLWLYVQRSIKGRTDGCCLWVSSLWQWRLIISGTRACGGRAGNPPGLNCSLIVNYTTATILAIDIFKRNADITYNLVNRSIERMENLSPIYETEYINPSTYLRFYDRIFPPALQKPPNNSLETTLETLLFQYCQSSSVLSQGNLFIGYIELLLLPWLIQQQGLQMLRVKQLPAENVITATYCKKSYKATVSSTSFYAFTFICFSTIGWCLFRLYQSAFLRGPVISCFGDINLLAKIFGKERRILELSKLGSEASSIKVERILRDVDLRITRDPRPRWDNSGWELDHLNSSGDRL
jgi:hypothetical protein